MKPSSYPHPDPEYRSKAFPSKPFPSPGSIPLSDASALPPGSLPLSEGSNLPDVHISQADLDNLYSSPPDGSSVPGDEDYPSVFGPEFLLLPPAAFLSSAFPGPSLAGAAALASPFIGHKLGKYIGDKLSQDGGLVERAWNRFHPQLPQTYDDSEWEASLKYAPPDVRNDLINANPKYKLPPFGTYELTPAERARNIGKSLIGAARDFVDPAGVTSKAFNTLRGAGELIGDKIADGMQWAYDKYIDPGNPPVNPFRSQSPEDLDAALNDIGNFDLSKYAGY